MSILTLRTHTCSLHLEGTTRPIFCNCEPLKGRWADLTQLASPSRCAWVEGSVRGCKSACSWTPHHPLLAVWSWAGERALRVAVCDQIFSRPGKEVVCHPYLLLDVSSRGVGVRKPEKRQWKPRLEG